MTVTTPDLKRIVNKAFVDQYGEEPDLIRVVRYRTTTGGYIKVYPSTDTIARIKDDIANRPIAKYGHTPISDFRAIQEEVYAEVTQHIPWLKKEEVRAIFRPIGPTLTTKRDHVEIILHHI